MNRSSGKSESSCSNDTQNVAIEHKLADRGWYMLRPSSESTGFEVKRTRVPEMELTETRIDRAIGRFDPQAPEHSYMSLGFLVEGQYSFEGPHGRLVAQAGDAVLWHSSVPMSFSIQEPMHLLSIMFCDQYLKSQILDIPSVAGMRFRPQDPFGAMLSGFMNGLLSEWQSFSTPDLTLALLAARSLMVKSVQKRRFEFSTNSRTERMTLAMNLIDKNLYDPELCPQKIASLLHMSLRNLYNLFSKSGLTVHGYIRDRRLEDCRQVIIGRRSDVNMRHLALSRGFNDLSVFSRAFKRKFGMSPTEFHRWVMSPVAGSIS